MVGKSPSEVFILLREHVAQKVTELKAVRFIETAGVLVDLPLGAIHITDLFYRIRARAATQGTRITFNELSVLALKQLPQHFNPYAEEVTSELVAGVADRLRQQVSRYHLENARFSDFR